MTHAKHLSRGATIYELDSAQRDAMKALTDAHLVVSIGEHKREGDRLNAINADLLAALELIACGADGPMTARAAILRARGEA